MYLSLELVTPNSTCCFAGAFLQNIESSLRTEVVLIAFLWSYVSNVWFTESNKCLLIE